MSFRPTFVDNPNLNVGVIDSIKDCGFYFAVSGWARDPYECKAACDVIITDLQTNILGYAKVNIERKDVEKSLNDHTMRYSGWRMTISKNLIKNSKLNLNAYVYIENRNQALLLKNSPLQDIEIINQSDVNLIKSDAQQFLKGYFESYVWRGTYFLGYPILKCPLDLWIYQEIIYEIKPDIIIETGTHHGGSALYLATMLDIIGKGEVITIDIDGRENRPAHPRINYLLGSSTSTEIIREVKKRIDNNKTVMVILDSDHSENHVYNEMMIYKEMVSERSFLIVEDGIVNGNPVFEDYGPGPVEAIKRFLDSNDDFEVDHTKEKFFVTFNPSGYLRKVSK